MFLWLSIASINGGVLSWVAAFLVLCRISVPYWKKLRCNDFFCSNIFNGLSKCRRRRFVWSPFKTKVSSVLPWLCLALSFYMLFRPSFSLHIDLAISLVCIRRIREVFSIFIANFGRAGKGAFGLCVALFFPFFSHILFNCMGVWMKICHMFCMHCIKQCQSDISSTRLSLLSAGEEKAAGFGLNMLVVGCRLLIPIPIHPSRPSPLRHCESVFNTPTIV